MTTTSDTRTTAGVPGQRGNAPYADLAEILHGELIRPGDENYDTARAVYNGMIDKRPAAIARCADVG